AGLERSPVREIWVRTRSHLDLSALRHAPHLETLRVSAYQLDLAGLGGSPLETLRAESVHPLAIPSLPRLEALFASGRGDLDWSRGYLPGLAFRPDALPALRRLSLERIEAPNLAAWQGSGLERLELRECRIPVPSGLGRLEHLRELGL